MKNCETCGKKLSTFDVWEINNKIQCKECADKEFKENHQNNDSVNENNGAANIIKTPKETHIKTTNVWASGMKILTIILLIVLLIASIIVGFIVGDESDSILLGLGTYIGLTVASFSLVGFSMSFLQLAEDVSYLKNLFHQEFEDR